MLKYFIFGWTCFGVKLQSLKLSLRMWYTKWGQVTIEKFAAMIEHHCEGIAAFCQPENKAAIGFVENFNNKILVLQRRAYSLRDEEYLRLKILTCMLPAI